MDIQKIKICITCRHQRIKSKYICFIYTYYFNCVLFTNFSRTFNEPYNISVLINFWQKFDDLLPKALSIHLHLLFYVTMTFPKVKYFFASLYYYFPYLIRHHTINFAKAIVASCLQMRKSGRIQDDYYNNSNIII